MKTKKLAWEIYPSFLIVVFLSLSAVSWYTAGAIRRDYYERVEEELASAVAIVAEGVKPHLSTIDSSAVDEHCKTLGQASRYRVTVLLISGEVIGDSEESPATMDNHGEREEVMQAIHAGAGQAKRYSKTLDKWMMYVARTLIVDARKVAVARVSLPLSDIDSSLSAIRLQILLAGLAIAAAAALMSVLVARKISRPLEMLKQRTEKVASGCPSEVIPHSKVEEIDSLAQSINQMVERMQGLEKMRQDFVANVSHELKTPITSIKGFTETLLDGAKDDEEALERFLKIIDRQSNRLQSIVEDLLVLSSIEHGTDSNEIEFEVSNLNNIMSNAVQGCRGKAAKKNIEITLCKELDLKARINVQLLEQALVNLIDNAVKYSESATVVAVNGELNGEEVVLTVRDEGAGIEQKHLARLFERFYRVDKSRSRKLGGTGLGLAIVKRIALAHGGRVEVNSEPGKGSTFSIIIPKA